MSRGAGHGGSCRGWLWGAEGSRVTQKIIFHPRCPPSAPLLCAGSLGQGNELFVPCSAGLFAFPLRAFCLCCSSSGRLATAASLEIAPAKPLLQKKTFPLCTGALFSPRTPVGMTAAAIGAHWDTQERPKQTFCCAQRGQDRGWGSLEDTAEGPYGEPTASFAGGCAGWKHVGGREMERTGPGSRAPGGAGLPHPLPCFGTCVGVKGCGQGVGSCGAPTSPDPAPSGIVSLELGLGPSPLSRPPAPVSRMPVGMGWPRFWVLFIRDPLSSTP